VNVNLSCLVLSCLVFHRYWRDQGHPWGGMHSTVEDLAILLRTLLNGGSYGGRSVWSPAAVRAMTSNQNAAE
jgi:hypothetical protein